MIINEIVYVGRYVKLKMPIEDFELRQSLGKGSFGCVCKCIRRSDGQVYAMKQVLSLLPRSNCKNSRKKIKRMPSTKSDSQPPSSLPSLSTTSRPSTMKKQKCSASSWSLPMKATFRYPLLYHSIKSRKPSQSNKESLRMRSGKLPTTFSKGQENYTKPTLSTEISNLPTYSSTAKLLKLVI